MISPRFGLPFILLTGLALVPTLIHTYIGWTVDDGLSVNKISRSLGGFQSEPTNKKGKSTDKTFQSFDWIERRYRNQKGETLFLFAARSYDQKRLYHHPELALVRGRDLESLGTVRMSKKPEIPIHILRGSDKRQKNLIVYTLLHENKFVNNPILYQLKDAWQSLFHPRRPMTLFFVYDAASLAGLPLENTRAVRLLTVAIESFLSQTHVMEG